MVQSRCQRRDPGPRCETLYPRRGEWRSTSFSTRQSLAIRVGALVYLDKTEIPTVGWMAIFDDPGGNRIGVMQPMPSE